MSEVAKDPRTSPQIFPNLGDAWVRGIAVADMLALPELSGAECVAGAAGLGRRIERVNVMEVPDITAWVKPHEMLLTTGYPVHGDPDRLVKLLIELDDLGLAGLAVKLGRYVDDLPPALLREAERRGFPLLALPDGTAFDEVLAAVLSEILNTQSALLVRSEEVHRALLQIVVAGGGLADIAQHVAELLEAHIIVTTADGRVLAETSAETSATTDAENGASAGLLDPVDAAADVLVRDPTGRVHVEELTYGFADTADPLIVVPVVAGRYDHGRLIALSRRRRLTGSDVHVLERAATVVALSITKQRELSAVESKYQGDFMRDVLVGQAGESADVIAHARGLGWDFDRPMVVLVAEYDEPAPRVPLDGGVQPPHDRFTSAWRSVLRRHDPSAAVVGLSDEVVAVIGVDPEGRTDAESLARRFVTEVAGDGGGGRRTFCTGTSRVVHDTAQLATAYQQARSAVRVGRWLHGAGALVGFDQLGVHRLLSLVSDAREVDSFVQDTLGPLASPDAADLRETLQSLLDHNLNVAETARDMVFHYNTLRYRIGKLERLLGPFMTDPHLRLDLAVALQALRMSSLRGGGAIGAAARDGAPHLAAAPVL